jgi:hypothetical protein
MINFSEEEIITSNIIISKSRVSDKIRDLVRIIRICRIIIIRLEIILVGLKIRIRIGKDRIIIFKGNSRIKIKMVKSISRWLKIMVNKI